MHSAQSSKAGLPKIRQAGMDAHTEAPLSSFGRAERSLIDSCQLSRLVLIGEMGTGAVLCLCLSCFLSGGTLDIS